jgi:hypothetical protein
LVYLDAGGTAVAMIAPPFHLPEYYEKLASRMEYMMAYARKTGEARGPFPILEGGLQRGAGMLVSMREQQSAKTNVTIGSVSRSTRSSD